MSDSESKWVSRNLRSGSLPHGPEEESLPEFRREHHHRHSSRPFLMRSHRERRRQNKKIGTWLFITAILAACVTIVMAMMLFSKYRPTDSRSANTWLSLDSFRFVDAGPDPILHNPSEIVERFLGTTTRAELEAICRKDDNSLEIIDAQSDEILLWLKGHREWRPIHEAKANGLLFTVFAVSHINKEPRPIYVVQTPDGAKIDIGAFLGWSSVPWEDLTSGKTTRSAIVRASVARVGYYNYRFKDDRIYQSYQLTPFGDARALYGYVLHGTPAAVALEKLIPADQPFPVILSLDDGQAGSTHRQFRITHVLAAGWVTGPEIIEDHLPQLVDDPSLLMHVPGKDSGLPSGSRNTNQ